MRIGVVPAPGAGQNTMAATGQLARLRRHWGAYRDAGHEVAFFSGVPDDPDWPGVEVRRPPVGSARTAALLRPVLDAGAFRRCDVLRATSLLGSMTCLVAHLLHRTPFVVSHGANYEAVAAIHGERRRAQKWAGLRRLAFRYAARVLVPNPCDAADLRRAFPRARIEHVPNWVDLDMSPAVDVRAMRRPGRSPRLLTVGRLVVEKNLERLARLYGPSVISLGAGPVAPALRALGVTTPGAVLWRELPEWHRRAWVYVAPALTEGHPKALLEAMASGLPCAVSTAIRGVVEDERTALTFDPADDDMMRRQIDRLIDDTDLAVRLGAAAREAANRYDVRVVLPEEIRAMEASV